MDEQLQMIWPEVWMTHWPEWQVPAGYLLRRFRDGDEEAYVELMHVAGFVIGTHSISPEIPLEYFEIYEPTCRTYGNYEKGTGQ